MQGITLLVFTGALLYLVRKLFSFVKALQAIQYVRHPMLDPLLLTTTGTIPGNALSFHRPAFLVVFYPKSRGLVMGAIYYSGRNMNVSVCNPRYNHTLLTVYSMHSFQVSRLGHLFIREFHDHSTMILRYSISQLRIYR